MPHLSTGRSGLRMGAEDQGLPPTPMHPQPTLKRTFYASTAYPYSGLSSPSCEGTLPLRSLPPRSLREGRRSGIMGDRRRMERAAGATPGLPLRAVSTLRAILTPTLPRLGGGGCRAVVAHRNTRLVSSASCEGKLPLRLLSSRRLREGSRSGIMGEWRPSAQGGKCDARASPTRCRPPFPPAPCPATA